MADITEKEISVFIEAIDNYFYQITGTNAEIQTSFLAEREILPLIHDFTGKIVISGKYHGCIYFSATRIMLIRLLLEMNEAQQTEAQWLDAVGEIANTLAGNARKYFGETMEISVPMVFQGKSEHLKTIARERPYVITFKWKKYNAVVIVDMSKK